MITARANGAAFWLSCSCVTQRTDHVKLQSVLGNPRWHGIYVAVYSPQPEHGIVSMSKMGSSLRWCRRFIAEGFEKLSTAAQPKSTVRPLRKINDRHCIYEERLIGAFA